MHRIFTLALVCVSLAGCAAPEQAPITSKELRTFSESEIMVSAKNLLKVMKVNEVQAFALTKHLEEMLADPQTKKRLESPGCNAVGAFQFGSGGFVISAGAGKGAITFAGGSALERFGARAMSVGATVGGDSTHGLLLVFGLKQEERFTDSYKFSGAGATIATTSVKVGEATPERGAHLIQYIGSGAGASASAATATGRLVLDRDANREPAAPESGR